MFVTPSMSYSLVALCVVSRVLESVALPVPAAMCIRYSITVPLAHGPQSPDSFILRVYGLADVDAQVPAPSWDGPGVIDKIDNNYAKAAAGNFEGAIENGMDQYAVYFAARNLSVGQSRNATLSGWWPAASYVSLQLRYPYPSTFLTVPASSFDTLMSTGSSSAPNPFIQGNPTVASYGSQARCISSSARDETQGGSPDTRQELRAGTAASFSPTSASCADGNTLLYRMSHDLTVLSMADSPTGQCSADYLFSPAYGMALTQSSIQNYVNIYNFSWGVIRIKVPAVFNSAAEDVYRGSWSDSNLGGYDVNYFSVSANAAKDLPDPNLPFTVNALMLQAGGMMTAEGMSYVLFAPSEVVHSIARANSTVPPKLFLPRVGVMAYVLAAPSYAFMFRYKEPSADWSGSPSNVPCMSTLMEMNASVANCTTLGNWAPQITRLGEVGSLQELADSVK
mmetsp:Transcript_12986/g.32718  ORF Transcript_12986/g.32718 Transcript_12986/m.32718 type:complete len:452 (+) Transcript_12986:55-1410(+)